MAVSKKDLVDKVSNLLVNSNMDSRDIALLVAAKKVLENEDVFSVQTFADLPAYSASEGRLIYVVADSKYYYSDGVGWKSELNSAETIASDIWGFGYAIYGIIGDNTTIDKSSPVSVIGGFADWSQVSAGCRHTAAMRQNGTLWAWGCNGSGRLGDNTTITKSSPVSVVGGFTDWCQVSAGDSATLSVRQNGTLWAWGYNGQGRLGDNTTVNKTSPVSVVGGFTDWCQVSAGSFHTSAVRQNGTLWAWGCNGQGRLGDNTPTTRSSPVSVVGGFTDWCQVSAGSYHTAAVRQNGTLWSWGSNACGRLGDNTIVSRSSPVSVVGGFTDWCQVSAGSSHTAALRQNGTLWSWGAGACGGLGDNSIVNTSSPVSVIGGFTDWCQVSAGSSHSSAVRQNGTLWSWGYNGSGKLGDNTIIDMSSPVSVAGGFADWVSVSTRTVHTMAIRTYICKGF